MKISNASKFAVAIIVAAAIVVGGAFTAFGGEPTAIIQKLQDVSVTIRSDSGFSSGQGSGTLFTRKLENGDTVTFVWTAAHVVDNLRKTRSIIDPDTGTPRILIEFDDASIVKEYNEGGRRVGESKYIAKLLRYSDADKGEDLALLLVRKKNYVGEDTTVKFYLDESIPPIGTELFHVGSLLGQVGSNSLTTGIVSQHGRVLPGLPAVFDQTTATAFPGSSGGGVFLKADGRQMGMLVRGAGEQFNFIVPARRLVGWARKAKVEWAVDHSVALPAFEELEKMKVEDTGVTFAKAAAADAKPHGTRFWMGNSPEKDAYEAGKAAAQHSVLVP
jgi:hypothetical protein